MHGLHGCWLLILAFYLLATSSSLHIKSQGIQHADGDQELSTTRAELIAIDDEDEDIELSPEPLGLPQECLTYEQRFGHHYHQGLSHSNVVNAMHPHSRYVVVLTLHKAYADKVPMDLILSLRAIAAEVTAAGYHFYILYQPPTNDFYMLTPVEETRLTREEVLESLPLDMRPFVIVHDYESDFAAYPLLGANDDPNGHQTWHWGPGPRAAYVAMSRFMQRYKGYDYAWVVEYDARWTGSNWGELFNAAMDLARQATEEELAADPWRLVRLDRPASRELPDDYEGLPDLLAWAGVFLSDKFKWMSNNMRNASELWETKTTVYMGSRRLWDAVHEYSLQGIGTHIESALPTIAMQRGLKVAGIAPPAHPTYEEIFHCCTDDARMVYSEWFNNTQICSSNLLLHPVKADEPFWPTVVPSSLIA